jgi:hypothetical protein
MGGDDGISRSRVGQVAVEKTRPFRLFAVTEASSVEALPTRFIRVFEHLDPTFGGLDVPSWLLLAGVIALFLISLIGLRGARCARPWPGIGDEVDSFEDLSSLLRLVGVPIAFGAAIIIGVLLAHRIWPGADVSLFIDFDRAKTEKVDVSVEHRMELALGSLAEAINKLTHGIEGTDRTKLERIVEQLKAIEAAIRDRPGLLADQFGTLREILEGIKTALDGKTLNPPSSVVEHLARIEDLLSNRPPASAPHCSTLSETSLKDWAEKNGLAVGQQFRITERELLFNPSKPELSPIGEDHLARIADYVRQRARALAIHAESDGAESKDEASKRLNTITAYLMEHAPRVPIVKGSVEPASRGGMEPYRRIAHIYLLEPCDVVEKSPTQGTGKR